jgi:hypothetical protein
MAQSPPPPPNEGEEGSVLLLRKDLGEGCYAYDLASWNGVRWVSDMPGVQHHDPRLGVKNGWTDWALLPMRRAD